MVNDYKYLLGYFFFIRPRSITDNFDLRLCLPLFKRNTRQWRNSVSLRHKFYVYTFLGLFFFFFSLGHQCVFVCMWRTYINISTTHMVIKKDPFFVFLFSFKHCGSISFVFIEEKGCVCVLFFCLCCVRHNKISIIFLLFKI